MENAIIKKDVYQRQQGNNTESKMRLFGWILETLIIWTELDGTDYALSFQDEKGCNEIWYEMDMLWILSLFLFRDCIQDVQQRLLSLSDVRSHHEGINDSRKGLIFYSIQPNKRVKVFSILHRLNFLIWN
jgi:hypothetical protein